MNSLGIKSKHTSDRDEVHHYVLAEVRCVDGAASPEIKPLDIKNRSIYFRNNYLLSAIVVELERDLILVEQMVVHEFKVIRIVQTPEKLELADPIKVTSFCFENFPFVIYT